jgi:hypothetical protein
MGVEIYPADLVISAVTAVGGKFRFLKLFSEHRGNCLKDVSNILSGYQGSAMIFVH